MQQSFMPDKPETPKGTPGSKKKHKPVSVWYRYGKSLSSRSNLFKVSWCRFGRYANHEIAKKVVSDQKRKYPGLWEFYIGQKPPKKKASK